MSEQMSGKHLPYLVVLSVFTLMYLCLPLLMGITVDGVFRYPLQYSAIFLVWAIPVSYVLFLWSKRSRLTRFDYLMFPAPLATWFVSWLVYKIVMWEVTGGTGIVGSFGADKAMTNLIVEPILVLVFSGLYLLRFRTASKHKPSMSAGRLLGLCMLIGVLVAFLVPGIRE